ncbi:hypothetical protein MCEGE10_01683 [Flavobacteriaceae bacterium]
MKKYILLFSLLFAQIITANTAKDSIYKFSFHRMLFEDDDCDACGCSANGGSMGFSSMLNNNFIGIRYINQKYTTKEGVFNNSPWTEENFNTTQVWARIPISDKIQITALVPFHFNNRELITGKQRIQGLGDITIMGMYSVFETHSDSTIVDHKFQLGGGIKVPFGKYNSANNGTLNPSFQLGTGSWDYLLVSEYVLKKDKFGLNTVLSYTFKTKNQQHYQFGNQFNYGSTLFYLLDINKIKIVPQAGISGEVYNSNQQFKQEVSDTKGDIVFGKFGLEIGKNKFSFGANLMLPISQNLTGGNVESRYRFSLNLNYQL